MAEGGYLPNTILDKANYQPIAVGTDQPNIKKDLER